jgi:predicted nucleic-acid-binding protein
VIGLDTNILVRLVVGDDPVQTRQAKRFVESRCSAESPGFINCVVLTEFVWVLARTYGYSRSEIAGTVESLLAGDDRIIEHHEAVRAGLDDYRSGRVDFIDAIIARINCARGCEATVTFDRKAARIEGFVRVT